MASNGDEGIRTPDPLLARQVLSQLSYTPMGAFIIHTDLSGIHLPSHAVTRIVLSAVKVLTVVFGMGTGVSPSRIDTGQFYLFSSFSLLPQSH